MMEVVGSFVLVAMLIYFAYKLYSIESGDFKERKTS